MIPGSTHTLKKYVSKMPSLSNLPEKPASAVVLLPVDEPASQSFPIFTLPTPPSTQKAVPSH